MSFLKHFGQSGTKYRYMIRIHSASGLPIGEDQGEVYCHCHKASPLGFNQGVRSQPAQIDAEGTATWNNELLMFPCTIYADSETLTVQNKRYIIDVKFVDTGKDAETKTASWWQCSVDLSHFVGKSTVDLTAFDLEPMIGGSSRYRLLSKSPRSLKNRSEWPGERGPKLIVSIESVWLSDEPVESEDEELSNSAVTTVFHEGNEGTPQIDGELGLEPTISFSPWIASKSAITIVEEGGVREQSEDSLVVEIPSDLIDDDEGKAASKSSWFSTWLCCRPNKNTSISDREP